MADFFPDIDGLLQGSIDMHLHHGPVAGPTRADALELAEQVRLSARFEYPRLREKSEDSRGFSG